MSFPKKVAVIGANGFVGSRIVETFHLSGICEVVPVVRGVNALPRLSRCDNPQERRPNGTAGGLSFTILSIEARRGSGPIRRQTGVAVDIREGVRP